MDIQIAYSYLLYFFDQLSCIKFFHLSYGLKDIEFQRFNQFKRISGFSFIIKSGHYPKQCLTEGAHLSYTGGG